MKRIKTFLLALALAWTPYVWAQTTTVANSSVPPALINRVGTANPAKCSVGELFFRSDATAGQNLYMCAAANTWTQQLNSGSSGNITIGTSTITSGTSGRVLYDNAGVIGEMTTTGSGTVLALATGATLVTPTLGVATATSINKMAITAPATSSTLAVADGKTLTASNTLTLAGTDSTTMTFPSVSATIPRVVASGAKALATSAISSAACSAAQTDTATGTLTTDAIIVSFNGDPTAVTGYVPLTTGMLTIIPYPTADTVNFKVCNNTSASITPGAITLNWRVVR